MRVYLGADHAGFERKNEIIEHLKANGHEAVDCGAHEYDAVDDYPAFCIEAAKRVVADEGSLGIVLGGSGNGGFGHGRVFWNNRRIRDAQPLQTFGDPGRPSGRRHRFLEQHVNPVRARPHKRLLQSRHRERRLGEHLLRQ